MLCPNCGTENRPGARFCAKCGATLVHETVAWPSPTPYPDYSAIPSASPGPSAVPPASPASFSSSAPVPVERRYPVLRVLGVIYKVLGGIVGALTVLIALGACIFGIAGGAVLGALERDLGTPLPGISGVVGGLITGLIVLLYGGFIAITLYAGGEVVFLFISMEENLRSLAQR